jgi:hypothetical protein
MARMLSMMYVKRVLKPIAATNSHLIVKIDIIKHKKYYEKEQGLGPPELPT